MTSHDATPGKDIADRSGRRTNRRPDLGAEQSDVPTHPNPAGLLSPGRRGVGAVEADSADPRGSSSLPAPSPSVARSQLEQPFDFDACLSSSGEWTHVHHRCPEEFPIHVDIPLRAYGYALAGSFLAWGVAALVVLG